MDAPAKAASRLMSMKEWLFDFRDEPFEFIDGEKIMWSPSVFGSNFVANRLARALNEFAAKDRLGEAFVELTIAFTNDPNWVRKSLIPDVAFVISEKLAAFRNNFPNWMEIPLLVIPDLVVEVISPTDRYVNVKQKVGRYIEEGIPGVWIIDYIAKVAEVITADGETELGLSDTLTLPNVLPGFALTVETLFT